MNVDSQCITIKIRKRKRERQWAEETCLEKGRAGDTLNVVQASYLPSFRRDKRDAYSTASVFPKVAHAREQP